MRNPNRIYKFCNVLANIWISKATDMRFGQFVEVVFSKIREEGKDPFYVEEEEMLSYIEKVFPR